MATAWGSLAEVVTASALVGALIFTVLAGRTLTDQLGTLRQHLDHQGAQLEILHAEQAAMVTERRERSARLVGVYEIPISELAAPKDREVYLRNAADDAIYDVTVLVVKHRDNIPLQRYESFQPRSHPYQLGASSKIIRDLLEEMAANDECTPEHVWRNTRFGLSITFRDASGHHWQRLPSGTLVALRASDNSTVTNIKTAAYEDWNKTAARSDA